MSVDIKTVKHVAHLARLDIDGAAASRMAGELSAVLDWECRLNDIPTDNVEPMVSPVCAPLPMRDDKVTDGNKRADVLRNAPLTEEGFFLVPKVVE